MVTVGINNIQAIILRLDKKIRLQDNSPTYENVDDYQSFSFALCFFLILLSLSFLLSLFIVVLGSFKLTPS